MSWSGPLPGAAPFQAPPYPNGQFGFGQHQPYQYGQQPPYSQYQQGPPYAGQPQRPQDNRPPKKKGNPVITRYPPPPGYRGPAQPHGPFNGHQQHAQYPPASQPGFPQVSQFPPKYSGQGYTAAPPHPGYPAPARGLPQPPNYPPSHPPAQNYSWPQQAHQLNHPQVSAYPGGQIHASQTSYQPHPTHTVVTDPNQQAYGQAPGWSQAQTQSTYQPQKQYSSYGSLVPSDQAATTASATQTLATASASTSSARPTQSIPHDGKTTHKSELYLAWDDWDFDFDGAIWPKSNEPVDPNLSLGVIIWHPAKQATRALPATFEEAEEQSLKPTPETLGNGESVSVYFTAENSHEAFLDVRQTDAWEYIKDDPIFVLFTTDEMQHNLIPIEDCISQRDRLDEPLEPDTNIDDAEMHEADWSVMDNLEQALSASGGEAEPTQPQTQEDVLASLGVTGLPKPVSQEAVPFPMPVQELRSDVSLFKEPDLPLQATTTHQQQPPRTRSLSSTCVTVPLSAPQRPYGSMSSSSLSRPPPPPPPVEHDRYDPWNPSHRRQQYHTNGFNGGRGSPARSEISNGTAAGSDFGTEKGFEARNISLTPGSKFERGDSSVTRKRSYGDTDTDDDRLREHDDHTKRKRRSLVDAAYGRR